MKRIIFINIILLFLFVFSPIKAQKEKKKSLEQTFKINNNISYVYKKPKFFDMLKYIPNDLYDLGKFVVKKENLKYTGLALGSTAAILPFDQSLLEGAMQLGGHINWDGNHSYGKIANVLKIVPQNSQSAVYYIGNGGTTVLLGGFFYGLGLIKNDYRALNTASELIEVLCSVGITTQTIKRISGRESPFIALENNHPGGQWSPFPSFSEYKKNTPFYDAMPSGHLATFVATITVIEQNYPEIKWIKPVGYTLAGVLAFEMVSSQVHWTSDYPIAILIGYVIGKNAARRRFIERRNSLASNSKKKKFHTDFNFHVSENYKLLSMTISF